MCKATIDVRLRSEMLMKDKLKHGADECLLFQLDKVIKISMAPCLCGTCSFLLSFDFFFGGSVGMLKP